MSNKLIFLLVLSALWSCSSRNNYIPKPRGYFRIDFPEKQYQLYESDCNFRFQYPVYGKIVPFNGGSAGPCWLNIEFSDFRSKIHLTYKEVNNNLAEYTEDIRTLANKHIPKADDIIEIPVINREKDVYGMIYDIRGNTASSFNFYLTDSSENFLSGALYFSSKPNKDSIAPVNAFLVKDIQHLIETFEWN